MRILSLLILFFANFSACSQKQQAKKYIPDPKAKLLNDSAINIFVQTQNNEKAILLLEEATRIDSNYYAAYANKLNFQSNLERFNDALATARNLIRINPDNVSSYFLTGILLDKTGDSINARKYYSESLKVIDSKLDTTDKANQKYEGSLINKGAILILLGQEQKGHDILRKICDEQKDPALKELYCELLNKSRKEILEDFFSSN